MATAWEWLLISWIKSVSDAANLAEPICPFDGADRMVPVPYHWTSTCSQLSAIIALLCAVSLFFPGKKVLRWISEWKCGADFQLPNVDDSPPIPSKVQHERNAQLLRGQLLTYSEETSPKHTRLASRNLSNNRIQSGFNLDNALTTLDPCYRTDFVHGVFHRLHNVHWPHRVGHIQSLIRFNAATQLDAAHVVNLSRLIQTVSLRAVLPVIFPDSIAANDVMKYSELLDEVTFSAAGKISLIWSASKTDVDSDLKQELSLLRSDLRVLLFRDSEMESGEAECADPRENPLNWIIPAYETMWRVVLRCFLEVRFRNVYQLEQYRKLFSVLLEEPTQARLRTRDSSQNTAGISVSDIVNESLRLYPPMRNIYRAVGHFPSPNTFLDLFGSKSSSIKQNVNIEALHRDRSFWGHDAEKFRSNRWSELEKAKTPAERANSFLPFGRSPFRCPAANLFAPQFIGVLVGGLLMNFPENEWKLVPECASMEEVFAPGPLTNERGAFKEVLMAKICR